MSEIIPNLNGASRIYAVFGDPVEQVQTPRLVNPIFAAAGLNLFAVPFHVPSAKFDATWDALSNLSNIAGIGVTVPHKVAAFGKCATLTPTARAVGAVNSIQRSADGQMHGALFDGDGFLLGLGEGRKRFEGANVLLIGAGGAGRAIAHALAGEDIGALEIRDIDKASATSVAQMVNQAMVRDVAHVSGGEADATFDVVINASPAGMKGDLRSPFPVERLKPHMLVADIAALAGETELLRAAQAAGAKTSDGVDMLQAQIALIAGFAAGLPAGAPLRP